MPDDSEKNKIRRIVIFSIKQSYHEGELISCLYKFHLDGACEPDDVIILRNLDIDQSKSVHVLKPQKTPAFVFEKFGNFHEVIFPALTCISKSYCPHLKWRKFFQFYYNDSKGVTLGASMPFELLSKSKSTKTNLAGFDILQSVDENFANSSLSNSENNSGDVKIDDSKPPTGEGKTVKMKTKQIAKMNKKLTVVQKAYSALLDELNLLFNLYQPMDFESFMLHSDEEKFLEWTKQFSKNITDKIKADRNSAMEKKRGKMKTLCSAIKSNHDLCVAILDQVNKSEDLAKERYEEVLNYIYLMNIHNSTTSDHLETELNEMDPKETCGSDEISVNEVGTFKADKSSQTISSSEDSMKSEEETHDQFVILKQIRAKEAELKNLKSLLSASGSKICLNKKESKIDHQESMMNKVSCGEFEKRCEQLQTNKLPSKNGSADTKMHSKIRLHPVKQAKNDQSYEEKHQFPASITELCPICEMDVTAMCYDERNIHVNSHLDLV